MAVEDALRIKEMEDTNIVPDTLLELYPYQRVGALFMLCVKKCFNLDDPGLGKTAQVLGYVKLLQKVMKKVDVKILVVATSSILFQWESETKKFTNLIPKVVDGKSKKARQTAYKNFQTGAQNILIINYTKILYDFDDINKIKFDAIVFDEASALKDRTTKIHQYYTWLTKNVDRVVMLTATPISNNLEEFYNLFDLFHQNFLPEYKEFRDAFLETKPVKVKKGGRTFTIDTVVGSKLDMIPVFRQMIEPYYIRRLNSDKGEFSHLKMNIIKRPIPMSKEQKMLCAELKRQHYASDDSQALKIHSDFTKISCAPQIYGQDYSNFSPKAVELIKIFKQNPDKKYVLFAKFTEYHQILRDYFDKAGIEYVSITGKQSSKEKEENKVRFNTDPNVRVILMTGAGKFGLNLQSTNQFIFVDMPYTPSDVFQYIGRVYRTGQTQDVDIHFFYHCNSLEENLFQSLERKQTEIDTFFEQDKADIFKLEIETDVDVRRSFLQINYNEGPYYDDIAQKEDYECIPEKHIIETSDNDSESSKQSEGFYSIDNIQL